MPRAIWPFFSHNSHIYQLFSLDYLGYCGFTFDYCDYLCTDSLDSVIIWIIFNQNSRNNTKCMDDIWYYLDYFCTKCWIILIIWVP